MLQKHIVSNIKPDFKERACNGEWQPMNNHLPSSTQNGIARNIASEWFSKIGKPPAHQCCLGVLQTIPQKLRTAEPFCGSTCLCPMSSLKNRSTKHVTQNLSKRTLVLMFDSQNSPRLTVFVRYQNLFSLPIFGLQVDAIYLAAEEVLNGFCFSIE